MFQWNSTKKQPNQQDKVHLLKTKFTMRLDIERRRIENSYITNLEDEHASTTQKIQGSTTEGIAIELGMVVDHEYIPKKEDCLKKKTNETVKTVDILLFRE